MARLYLLLKNRVGNDDDLTCKVALAVDCAKLGGVLLLKSVLGQWAEEAQVPFYKRPTGRCRQLSDRKPEHTREPCQYVDRLRFTNDELIHAP